MDQVIPEKLMAYAGSSAEMEKTVQYLAEHLRAFLKQGERVLICFSNARQGSLGRLMEQAVLRCGGVPVIWGPDYRWKTVLQQAFYSHASVIMAPPLIALGLSKLKKHTGLPVYIRHAVTAGYPCLDWMIDGIMKGLDCTCRGIFSFGETGIVAGFSCHHSRGVHIREDVYGVDITAADGNSLPVGQMGEVILYPKDIPQLRLVMDGQARLVTEKCPCGCPSPRLLDLCPGRAMDAELMELGHQLQSWTSVLDCSLKRGSYGLEMELVVFPGEKLPKLPSAAKQVIRPWDPKHDRPFFYGPTVKNRDFSLESH